jgi:hypothetical protein
VAVVGLDIALAIAAVVLVALLGVVFVTVRRRTLARSGAFECALRTRHAGDRASHGWSLGMARYSGDELEWYRVFAPGWRPARRVSRRGYHPVGLRTTGGTEVSALPHDAVVLEGEADDRPLDLAMSEQAITGFLAWVEAVPPGAYLDDSQI